jgi:hypothetical protein
MQQRPKKLLEQVRDAIRLKHYAYRTEQTYIHWIRRYILFHNKRHPIEIGDYVWNLKQATSFDKLRPLRVKENKYY